MTGRVLVDSSAFVALYNTVDSCHEQAKNISHLLVQESKTLATSYEVILETATVLRRKVGLATAKKFLTRVRDGSFLILTVDDDIRLNAVKLFLYHQTPNDLSLFDCLYVSLIKTYEIEGIFSFDRHFKKLGVKLLSA